MRRDEPFTSRNYSSREGIGQRPTINTRPLVSTYRAAYLKIHNKQFPYMGRCHMYFNLSKISTRILSKNYLFNCNLIKLLRARKARKVLYECIWYYREHYRVKGFGGVFYRDPIRPRGSSISAN